MPDGVRVSVVVPLYNAERYIEATVRSALNSTLRELEIVLVDDGSTDRSVDIVRKIADPRIVLIQSAPSGSAARPRNIGVARASAPYVAFLDADDLLKPDKLLATVTALDRHPEASFAFGNFERIDSDGNIIEASAHEGSTPLRELDCERLADSWRLISSSEMQRGLLHHNFIGTSSVTVRKSAAAVVGPFDENLKYAEDDDLWLRLAHHGSALYWDRVGNSYRIRPGSLTYRDSERSRQDHITMLRHERDRRSSRSERRRLNRRMAGHFEQLGYLYRRRHERLRAAAAFAQALVRQPRMAWLRALVGSLVRPDPAK